MISAAPASRAASAAQMALVASLGSLWLLIAESTRELDSRPAFIVMFAFALAASAVLHFIFLALFARRTGRSVMQVVGISLLTFPLGSIVGLVLYEWHTRADTNLEKNAG